MKVSHVLIYRRLLVGIIVVLLVAVCFNYLQSWRRRNSQVQQTPDILSGELSRSVEGIEYTERRHGQVQFKLKAARLRETRGGKSFLEGIEGFDLNPDGSIRNEIRSREAEYDRETKQALFVGDVELRMGQSVRMRTQSLHYDQQAQVGTTEDPVELESPEIRGTAKGIRYDALNQVLNLQQDIDFFIQQVQLDLDGGARTESYHVLSGKGVYSGASRTMHFESGARIEAARGTLSADSIEAQLSPEAGNLTGLVCEGNARYQDKSDGVARVLQGNRMAFEVAEKGRIREIRVDGQAILLDESQEGRQELSGETIRMELDLQTSRPVLLLGGGQAQMRMTRSSGPTILQGETIEMRFVPGTSFLDAIRAHDRARIAVASPGGATDELEAQHLNLSFRTVQNTSVLKEMVAEQSVSWKSSSFAGGARGGGTGTRTMSADWLRLTYSPSAGAPDSGNASGHVVLRGSGGPGDGADERRLECDQAYFAFHPGGKSLRVFEGSGNVAVSYSRRPGKPADARPSDMRTNSANIAAHFLESDGSLESVAQWGNFRYSDNVRQARSERCDYTEATGILVLTGSPVVTDQNSTTSGLQMEYHRSQNILRAKGHVRSVLKSGGAGGGGGLLTNSGTSSSPSIVTAEQMEYSTQSSQVTYRGKVQLLSENSQLQSESLLVRDSGNEIVASGGSRHLVFSTGAGSKSAPDSPRGALPTRIDSATLRFTMADRSIFYAGGATLQSQGTVIVAESLQALLDAKGGQIERAIARNDVRITREGREARGEVADYYLHPGKFVVTGNPASITDPLRGRSSARRLTFFTADDRILLEYH